jgi:hypothetical protein
MRAIVVEDLSEPSRLEVWQAAGPTLASTTASDPERIEQVFGALGARRTRGKVIVCP